MLQRFVILGALAGLSLLVSGCGGASSPSVANVATTTTSTVVHQSTSSASPSTQDQLRQENLKFSACMRSNGVPNFPDPSPGGGFVFRSGSGLDPSSPAVKRAQAKCRKYMPGGGGISPGAQTHPTAQWLEHMDGIARCMRRHGVADFPDPRTSIPSPLPTAGIVSNIQGAVLVFPDSNELQTPVFLRAATACGYPLHNH
jgi:hypothetical protein